MKLHDWLKSGKYLPKFLRDFHDQKDVFKTIHKNIDPGNASITDVNWRVGHCYVIDIFLWYMAKCGYTLQKSRQPLKFDSLEKEIEARKEAEALLFVEHMRIMKEEQEAKAKAEAK